MSNEKLLQTTAHQTQIKTLISIRDHGLAPLNKQPNHSLSNPTLNIQSIEGNICVNHVNLTNATTQEINTALHVAVHEEYCGIYGIAMERQWGLQRFNDEKTRLQEMEERLQSCIVFILDPPGKLPVETSVHGNNNQLTKISHYEFFGIANPSSDGFSQVRGRSLVAQPIAQTNRVTEIKTVHTFNQQEIRAALVPAHLMNLAKDIFANTPIKLIEVPSVAKEFTSFPEILTILHDEKHNQKFTANCPDFSETLRQVITQDSTMKNFALHAVRLHTSFDFMPRYVLHYQQHSDFINKNHGMILSTNGNNAWIIFHKSVCTSKQKTTERLQHSFPQLVEKIVASTKQQEEQFKLLKSFQGEFELFCYFKSITAEKIAELKSQKTALLACEHYVIFAFKDQTEKQKILQALNAPKPEKNTAMINTPAVATNFSHPTNETKSIEINSSEPEEKLYSSSFYSKPTPSAEQLYAKAIRARANKDSNEAIALLHKALPLFKEQSNHLGTAQCYHMMGDFSVEKRMNSTACSLFKQAIDAYKLAAGNNDQAITQVQEKINDLQKSNKSSSNLVLGNSSSAD